MTLNYSIIAIDIMSDLYVAWRKVSIRIFRVPYRTHNEIVIKLGGDIVSWLDRRIAKFSFNYDNHVVQNITKFKLGCPRSTLTENYKYLLYKYKFLTVRELCELRDVFFSQKEE